MKKNFIVKSYFATHYIFMLSIRNFVFYKRQPTKERVMSLESDSHEIESLLDGLQTV